MINSLKTHLLTTLAQAADNTPTVDDAGGSMPVENLIAALVFSALGILILGLSFWLMDKVTPFSIRKEIEEDQNTALGIVMGATVIAMAIIIAAAIHG